MKPFDLQRYLMGFLLPGAQPLSAHSLSWGRAQAMTFSLHLCSTRCRWQCRGSAAMVAGLSAPSMRWVIPYLQGTCPSLSCCPTGETELSLCLQTSRKPHKCQLAFEGNTHSLPESKTFILSSLLMFRGKGYPSEVMALLPRGSGNLLGAVWLLICQAVVHGAGSLLGLYCCLQVSLLTSVPSPFFFFFLIITWGWDSSPFCRYMQVSRPLLQRSPSTDTWASVSKAWKIQSTLKNQ